MQPLTTTQLQEVDGGSVLTVIIYVAIGGAIYKIITSSAGRISIPNIISIEWR